MKEGGKNENRAKMKEKEAKMEKEIRREKIKKR